MDKPLTEIFCEISVSEEELPELLGLQDRYLRMIEAGTGAILQPGNGVIVIRGAQAPAAAAAQVLSGLQAIVRQGRHLTAADVRLAVRAVTQNKIADVAALLAGPIIVTHRGTPVCPKTAGQAQFIQAVRRFPLVFCVGPAGTGKTYLAMALALAALRDKKVSRIVLTRPVIEAGERLGFLPGDMLEKMEPYMRPLYDALQDIMGPDKLQQQRQRGTIEIVPLAYMRGRTINDAFLVLDEAQNTTPMQMKMALTRLGLGSQMIVTGDLTQSDLPENQESGLQHSLRVLSHIKDIAICYLTNADIVRHDLVQQIVEAYEAASLSSSLSQEAFGPPRNTASGSEMNYAPEEQ